MAWNAATFVFPVTLPTLVCATCCKHKLGKLKMRCLFLHMYSMPPKEQKSDGVSFHDLYNSNRYACLLQEFIDKRNVQEGNLLHAHFIISGIIKENNFYELKLATMYALSGSMESVRQVFDTIPQRSVSLWNVMIRGYACNGQSKETLRLYYQIMHGHGEEALVLFSQLQQTVLKPDNITFVGVMSSCSHGGLVDKGKKKKLFDEMIPVYQITPMTEHYVCMVDLLEHAGCLDKAHDFINKMPVKPSVGVWGALLGTCRVHCNTDLRKKVAEHLFDLGPQNVGRYVLMSNLFATTGKWDDVAKLRILMKARNVKKPPGCSSIEIGNIIHSFIVGDKRNPESDKIYRTLDILVEQMKEAGYVPNMNFVLHEVKEAMELFNKM